MDQTVIMYCVCSAVGGWALKSLFGKSSQEKNSSKNEERAEKISEENHQLKNQLSELKMELTAEIQEERNKLNAYKLEMATVLQEAKEEAYANGVEDEKSNYQVICIPYSVKQSKMLVFTEYKIGYRYQLLVKGMPAMESKDVPVSVVDELNESALQLVTTAAGGLLSTMNGKGIAARVAKNFIEAK
jgi:hypothetical protein